MLEFFRRHQGSFLIVLTIVIILSFSVWGGWKGGKSSGALEPTDVAFELYGNNYTRAELGRQMRFFDLAQRMGLRELAMGLYFTDMRVQTMDRAPIDFAINQLVLEHEMDALGVMPTDEEAIAAMQKMPQFQQSGQYDPNIVAGLEQQIGSMGFHGQDMVQLVKDDIGLRRLKEIVTGNYAVSGFALEKRYASSYQTIKASTIAFALDAFKKDAKVTDEEIQKYFDENKDTFKSAEKRGGAFLTIDKPQELEKLPTAEERQKKQKEYSDKIEKVMKAAREPGVKFEALAKEHGLKLETLAPFENGSPPDSIKDKADIAGSLFGIITGVGGVGDPVSTPKAVYLVQLTQLDESKPQDLPAVKDKIKETLTERTAREAMTKAANDASKAISEGLKAGKKIADLVKEQKLTMTDVEPFSVQSPPPNLTGGSRIASLAGKTPSGSLAEEPVQSESGMLLLYVNSRELYKSDDAATRREQLESSAESQEQDQIFRAWFAKRRDAAKESLKFMAAAQ
ncbi:MAG: peptidyl-prolyl cis-trans isomerase [Verrucomicrobiales bacterium]|nr:peptidyl-prolyl cis-trans isomerase [Verrucomicrobiales bacterium]MCP5556735.1 peptidyl-prolyl cis-trans isomerase [Verrucomicrobiaceae bacterium]